MNNPLGVSPRKGIREPHEVKKKSFDLSGNRTHDLGIRSIVTNVSWSLEFVISLQYYKAKPLSFKTAIVTSLIDLSALIPSGGFKLVQ